MNLRSGARLFVLRPKGRSGDFQAFLTELRLMYRGWHGALLLDEDPCHTAQASARAAEGMPLLWLSDQEALHTSGVLSENFWLRWALSN